MNTTTIRVTNEFKQILGLHGRFGERYEDILLRLLPNDFLTKFTGDRKKKINYSKDIDSKKYKRADKTGGKNRSNE